MPVQVLRFRPIGIADVGGSLGLIAAVATGTAPVLTAVALAGLATIAVKARVLGLHLGGQITALVNLGLMALHAVVVDANWK